MQETWVQPLAWEDSLEKEMATHSSILAQEIHGQRSLVSYSPWFCRVRHDLVPKEQQLYPHLYLDVRLYSYLHASVHAYSVVQTCLTLCQ